VIWLVQKSYWYGMTGQRHLLEVQQHGSRVPFIEHHTACACVTARMSLPAVPNSQGVGAGPHACTSVANL
jgi:hypothetical protein